MERDNVVSAAAYSLFYRLRGHVPDISSIAYDQIELCPDLEFLEKMKVTK